MFEDEFLREESENGATTFRPTFSVLDWLQAEFGGKLGKDIYTRMQFIAVEICKQQDINGKPGLLFTARGGEFVSLED